MSKGEKGTNGSICPGAYRKTLGRGMKQKERKGRRLKRGVGFPAKVPGEGKNYRLAKKKLKGEGRGVTIKIEGFAGDGPSTSERGKKME